MNEADGTTKPDALAGRDSSELLSDLPALDGLLNDRLPKDSCVGCRFSANCRDDGTGDGTTECDCKLLAAEGIDSEQPICEVRDWQMRARAELFR